MKILITGGTGFIGSRLAQKCLEKEHHVSVLGRQDASETEIQTRAFLEKQGIRIILGSVTDRQHMFEISTDMNIVFHLAAAQHEMNVPDELFRTVNVEGTRNMLDASLNAGVDRFVHGSSIGVYDRDISSIVDESTPLRPDNIYGVTKAEGEMVVRECFERQSCTIIRISETYGPGDRRLLKLFRGLDKGVFFVIGKGDNIHQLIFVDDLVDGLLVAANHPSATSETFVLAGRERLTTNDMVGTIAEAVGVQQKKWRAPLWPFMSLAAVLESTLRPLGIQPPLHRRRMDFFTKSFQISTAKAKSILDFEAATSFAEGTRNTASWYQENGLLK